VQRIDRSDPDEYAAGQRLILALTMSVLLHGMVLWIVPDSGIEPAVTDVPALTVAPRLPEWSATLRPGATAIDAISSRREAGRDAISHVDSPDPGYYPVAALDVLPAPREPLRLGRELPASHRLRLLTYIDASGRVTGVSVLESDVSEERNLVAQRALREADFNPARKDGRAVRSEVVIELAAGSDRD
jgi:TonB family protein